MGGSNGNQTTGYEPLFQSNPTIGLDPNNPLLSGQQGDYHIWGPTGAVNAINPLDFGQLSQNSYGLPPNAPLGALTQGMQNGQMLYNEMSGMAPQFYQNAQANVGEVMDQQVPRIQDIYGQAVGAQGGLTSQALQGIRGQTNPAIAQQGALGQQGAQAQNPYTGAALGQTGLNTMETLGGIGQTMNYGMGQVNSLLDNYSKNYIDQLTSPAAGSEGQKLQNYYNSLGLLNSGAFNQELGDRMANLGAENERTLGQSVLTPGIQSMYNALGAGQQNAQGVIGSGLGAQQNALQAGLQGQLGTSQAGAASGLGMLGSGLNSQLGTAQQGAQQAGQFQNLGGMQLAQLAQERGLAPLDYQNQALNNNVSLLNEQTQLPIQWWQGQNQLQQANQIADKNAQAQESAAGFGALGSLGSLGMMAAMK
jgi:hypothetical protein